ncbi:helix-turn-helix transcriptional regulator [Amorphus sp. 3PC139-8]|uniref:helix-turn-helix transcriptional regulator n=1 Tax=Amorphus sp. 3PC139-8 TaxID=2735676 RepID=UPI00345D4E52
MLDAFDEAPPPNVRLTTDDLAKLHAARDTLDACFDRPPSLSELSLHVGLNRRKLTAGFKLAFETTVADYVQTLRLDTAFQLLAAGNMNVATIAYKVGYAPAHLSVAFRKRFGVSPKEVRGDRAC